MTTQAAQTMPELPPPAEAFDPSIHPIPGEGQQPAACRCVDCGGDQPGHDPHCANMREIHGTQPQEADR